MTSHEENINEEKWLPIVGYEGLYEISNLGRVKSFHKGKKLRHEVGILKPCILGKYYRVVLHKPDHKRKLYGIHRLVAAAFIPNPNNYPEVNHIDENKLNNRVSNLEWVSHKYNIAYSNNLEKAYAKTRKAVVAYTKDGQFVGEYRGVREAARANNVLESCVLENVRGGRVKTVKGLIFKYK